jgi:hypothetical protein
MTLDQLLHEQLMRALLGRGGDPRSVFRTMIQVKRNEIFWKLHNE